MPIQQHDDVSLFHSCSLSVCGFTVTLFTPAGGGQVTVFMSKALNHSNNSMGVRMRVCNSPQTRTDRTKIWLRSSVFLVAGIIMSVHGVYI